MFEKSCRCGASKKNFKIDIGPFFVDDCCLKAGYDELGKKPADLEDIGLKTEEVKSAIESESTTKLEIEDDPALDAEDKSEEIDEAVQEVEETIEQEEKKKKRQYNRNGKIKVQP